MSRTHARHQRMKAKPAPILGVTMFGADDPPESVSAWLRRCGCPSVIEQHRADVPVIVRVLHEHNCKVVRELRRRR